MKNLSEFNVTPSFEKVQTTQIQNAINITSETNDVLYFEKGTYITGLLEMKDNTNIVFEKGTIILGASNLSDYEGASELFVDAVGAERGRCLLYANGKNNISLNGECIIDGRSHNFSNRNKDFGKRPFLLNFINCSNITLNDITFKNSPAWMLCLSNCNHFVLQNLTLFNRTNINNDGIDINSCQNGAIRNCIIDTGDDAICIKSTYDLPCKNILIEDCTLCTEWGAFKIGTESVGNISNIHMRNCFIHDNLGCAIKILSADGANIYNILIENITLLDVTGPIFITNGNRLRSYQNENTRKVAGKISNITIKNITGNVKNAYKKYANKKDIKYPSIIVAVGMQDTTLENISFSDFNLVFEGGEFAPDEQMTEIGAGYPEFNRLGILPSSKIYAKNINNFSMDSINIRLEENSSLPEIILENVN